LDSGFNSTSSPLVFLRPVGFAAEDSLRLIQAAQRMSEWVRWRLAPTGVQADVYLAHRASVVYGPAPEHTIPDSLHSADGASVSGLFAHAQLYLDENGWYKSHPVCLLGSAAQAVAPVSADQLPSLQFPKALEDLRRGLLKAEAEIVGLRALYALGRYAWEERKRWKTHRLHVIDGSRLIAAIEPLSWRIHLLGGIPIAHIEAGNTMLVPQSSAFAAPGFDTLRLEHALWEFAKRCPESILEKVLPSIYLRARLTHRRTSELSKRALGDHCVAILRALDTRSRTADELQTSLRLSRPALLRALASLALTRAIRTESGQHTGLRSWLGWLPKHWQKQLLD
jgi:hypothetical protein